MQRLRSLLLVLLALSLRASGQQRTVSITVDDLPYVGHTGAVPDGVLTVAEIRLARAVNQKLLRAFKKQGVPVTGFVNEKRVQVLGPKVGPKILREWIARGFDLGNHTYSHSDVNHLSVSEIEDEVLRGEATFVPLMTRAGRKPTFFRFPFNHTGDNKAKHDAISSFLAQHGYKLATCTIENSDYLFNDFYLRTLAEKDVEAAKKLRLAYLAYTSSKIDYFAALNKQVLGYEPPQVMLLHDNQLNGDVIDSLLELFEQKGYKFVSLATAESDAAYAIPDTYITQYGWMWGYRWAKELKEQVNGRLEPEPPEWVLSSAGSK
jgi:peptidoglycan/xylan/chitin deacetylase (PgdA/CDA1 family)